MPRLFLSCSRVSPGHPVPPSVPPSTSPPLTVVRILPDLRTRFISTRLFTVRQQNSIRRSEEVYVRARARVYVYLRVRARARVYACLCVAMHRLQRNTREFLPSLAVFLSRKKAIVSVLW